MLNRGIRTAFTKLVRDGQPKLEHGYPEGIRWRWVCGGFCSRRFSETRVQLKMSG